MKIETVLKHMSRIKLNGRDGIISAEVSTHEKAITMKGPVFYRLFPDHKTEGHQKYVYRQGVRILTYDPDPDSDEADVRQGVQS